MKSKLPVSPAKSYQDPVWGDLEGSEIPQPSTPTVDELIGGVKSLSSAKDPTSNSAQIGSLPGIQNSTAEPEVDSGSIIEGSPTDESGNDSLTTNQPNTSGEQSITGEKEIVLTETTRIEQPSFVELYWPFLLIGLTLVGWVLSQLLVRREPSFKPSVPKQPKKQKAIEEDKIRGQFKKSERFVKPKKKSPEAKETKDDATADKDDELDITKASSIENKITDNPPEDAMPADDEFEFDLSDGGSDSDIFSSEDADEIAESVDVKKTNASSKRFKTEGNIDEFQVDDDEVVSFDDEDSQLSLADSDTEFGFDLDDEESKGFLDSNKIVAEKTPDTPQVADESLLDQGLDDITEDAVTDVAEASAAVSGSAAKGSFFSRIFGVKNKQNGEGGSEEAALEDSEVGSIDMANDTVAVSDQVEQIADGPGELDFPDMVEDAADPMDIDDSSALLTADDSDDDVEFDFDDEEETPSNPVGAVADNISTNSIAKPASAEVEAIQPQEVAVDPDGDSNEFGFGLFDGDATESTEVAEVNDVAVESTVAVSEVATATVGGAGLAGTAHAKISSTDESDAVGETESENQWQSQVSTLKDENNKLSDQVAELKQQIAEAKNLGAQSDSLLKEREELTKTIKSLGVEKEELLSEKTQLAEESTLAKQQHAALEQEKADLLQAREELTETVKSLGVEKEELLSEKTQLAEESTLAKQQHAALEQEKADLLQAREELTETVKSLGSEKDELLSEKTQLAEEFTAVKQQHAVLEQEKADLLKQYEELKAESEATDASASELTSLQAEVAALADQRSGFEAEIQSLKAKLLEVETEPASTGSDEDIEDLKVRFQKCLAAERQKRKQAELLVSQAEDQRNEVAKLLRAAKAEMLTLKTKHDNEDFDVGH